MQRSQKIFQENVGKCPNLECVMPIQVQEEFRTPDGQYQNRKFLHHITVKTLNI